MAGAWRRSRWRLARSRISRNKVGGLAFRCALRRSRGGVATASLSEIRPAIGGLLLAIALSAASPAHAHDASSYGGLFRSRNLGVTWLNPDLRLFVTAPLPPALSPRAPP